MLRATIKSLLARKLRLALTALAVVLGVGMTAGSFILTDTALKSFDDLFGDCSRAPTSSCRPPPRSSREPRATAGGSERKPIPESVLPQVQAVDGVGSGGWLDRRHGLDRRSGDEQGGAERRRTADRRIVGPEHHRP